MTALSAADLARAFDADFVRPAMPRARGTEDLIAIRVADAPYALARGELAGLYVDKAVTALPGAAPGLLGVAGFRGALVPVYDLRALLGGPATDDDAPPRWMATAAAAPVALAFTRFDAFLRAPRDAIASHAGGAAGHAHRALRIDGALRPILEVAWIVEAIRARVRGAP